MDHSTLLAQYHQQLNAWRNGQLQSWEMACYFFIFQLYLKHGEQGGRRGHVTQEKLNWTLLLRGINLEQCLQNYFYKNVRPKVVEALHQWSKGQWNLQLTEKIPSALNILVAQTKGARPVTMLSNPERWNKPVLTKEDAFDFFVHDLEHAYQFNHQLHREQIEYSQFLLRAYEINYFSELEGSEFHPRLDYLLSDMNTHPIHAEMFMKSLWIDFYKSRKEPFQEKLQAKYCQWRAINPNALEWSL